MIKLTRIDDRLLHGQVAFTWIPSLGIDCIMVANDKVAGDEFLKMTLNLAKPASAKLLILKISDAILFLNSPKSKNLKLFILINSIADAASLISSVPEIASVNLGGLRTKEGAKLISKAISVNETDINILKQLLEKGVELEIRQVPTEKKQLVQTLI